MQKHVNLVDLVKSFPTNIFLQNLVSIQKSTSPPKFAHLGQKSEKGSISSLSTKRGTAATRAMCDSPVLKTSNALTLTPASEAYLEPTKQPRGGFRKAMTHVATLQLGQPFFSRSLTLSAFPERTLSASAMVAFGEITAQGRTS